MKFLETLQKYSKNLSIAGPVVIVLILAMMVLPLPPFLLDLMFTFNIAISLVVLLVAMNSLRTLDFLAFPTVLLITTLLRLSLNVASTRAVLVNGHSGADAAGKVIESFGHFLIGGNFAVGIIVFMVLTIINFIVITKGAGRIAEVAARFTLDAMPGKQMAIDADLSAGLIQEEEAKKRRREVTQEAEFYGSMDGASKFVRGDAIAALMIMAINLIGGLIIGVVQHDMSAADAARTYTLLTIGDGLVAQIPALIISTAAGIMVSRVGSDEDVGKQMVKQLTRDPKMLYIVAGIIALMGVIPGMPHLSFITLAAAIGAGAYFLEEERRKKEASKATEPKKVEHDADKEVAWDDIDHVEEISMEVGYRLIPMLDKNIDQDLLRRIRSVRKKFSQDMGFLPSVVHVRDNIDLAPNEYRILIKGTVTGGGLIYPEKHMVIAQDTQDLNSISGERTTDPSFGMPAVWIDGDQVESVSYSGHTVVDAGTVIATHISQVLRKHASELLGREEVQELLEHLKKIAPKLVEDVVPKVIPMATVQKVLQNLLVEGVSIRDAKTILETLAEHYTSTQDTGLLTGAVRAKLARAIVQQIVGSEPVVPVMTLSPKLEGMLIQAFNNGGADLDGATTESLLNNVAKTSEEIEAAGANPVLLVSSAIRMSLSRFLRRSIPNLVVLANEEIPDGKQIRITNVIG